MSAVLEIRALTVGYGREPVLADVDLEVRAGELWFLVGPNGAGKTTLLRAILGELRPSAGELHRADVLARGRRVGFVPQRCDFDLTLPTTVREFVLLGTTGLGLRRAERRERLGRALELVGLEGRERADYRSLSGGQRQRVLVARALVREPRLLIADEPTAGLDLTAADSLLRSLARLASDTDVALIVVMHDLEKAVRYGRKFALCAGGRLEAGEAGDVLRPDTLRRAYGLAATVRRGPDGALSLSFGGGEVPA